MFFLSEEEKKIKRELHDFVNSEIMPVVNVLDASGTYPEDIVRLISEKGYCTLPFSKELGGMGYGAKEGLMFIEEVSRASASIGFIYTASTFQTAYALKDTATEKQRKEWLIPAVRGEKILTLALSEEMGGSDAFAIKTYAENVNDGWILNGSKCWITNAGIADGYIVGARTSESHRSRDVSLFYVDAKTPGIEYGKRLQMIGLKSSPTNSIYFNDCHLSSDALIGEVGTKESGYYLIKKALNTGRLSLAAVAIGLAQGAMNAAVSYTRQREYYGRVISNHQGVSFPIADMYTDISLSRNMLYHVADMLDAGQSVTVDCAKLKLFSSEMAQRACVRSAELHGAIGFDKDFEVERFLRDSMMLTTAEGTSQICRGVIANGAYNIKDDIF